MKVISLILSFIFFGMAFTPCGDSVCEDHLEDHPVSTTHDHSEDGEDECTPFCICQCCGISIVSPQSEALEEVVVRPSRSYTFHFTFQYDYHYSFGIWHPPSAC